MQVWFWGWGYFSGLEGGEPWLLTARPRPRRNLCSASSAGTEEEPHKLGVGGETQPSSQETASVLASFVLLTSWKTYWRKVGRKDASVKGQKQRGSRWWELGAANSTICLPHLLILHTILQLAPPLPGTTPSLFHLKAGREAL